MTELIDEENSLGIEVFQICNTLPDFDAMISLADNVSVFSFLLMKGNVENHIH